METQCQNCKENFDDSTMWKSKVYYRITKEAEESRKQSVNPFEFRLGIVNVIEQLHCSEEQKRAAKYDLEHNYEIRILSYCERCAPLANFMQMGPN